MTVEELETEVSRLRQEVQDGDLRIEAQERAEMAAVRRNKALRKRLASVERELRGIREEVTWLLPPEHRT
jgi:hypothetical protein